MDHHKSNDGHDNTPVKEEGSQTRRAALKKIAVGSGIAAGAAALPSKWTKPIADRVLIPAHAQTSGGNYDSGDPAPPPKGSASTARANLRGQATDLGDKIDVALYTPYQYQTKANFGLHGQQQPYYHKNYDTMPKALGSQKLLQNTMGGTNCGGGTQYLVKVVEISAQKLVLRINDEIDLTLGGIGTLVDINLTPCTTPDSS